MLKKSFLLFLLSSTAFAHYIPSSGDNLAATSPDAEHESLGLEKANENRDGVANAFGKFVHAGSDLLDAVKTGFLDTFSNGKRPSLDELSISQEKDVPSDDDDDEKDDEPDHKDEKKEKDDKHGHKKDKLKKKKHHKSKNKHHSKEKHHKKEKDDREPEHHDRPPMDFEHEPEHHDRPPMDFEHGPKRHGEPPEDFERKPEHHGKPPKHFEPGPDHHDRPPKDFEHGPEHHGEPPRDFERKPEHRGEPPRDFERKPEHHGKPPMDFEHEPEHRDRPPMDFEHGPEHHDRPPMDFDHEPEHHDRPPMDFEHGPERHGEPPRDFERKPEHHGRPPKDFEHGPEHHGEPPRDFERKPEHHGKPPKHFEPEREHHGEPPRDFERKPEHHGKPPKHFEPEREHRDRPPKDFEHDRAHHEKPPKESEPEQHEKQPKESKPEQEIDLQIVDSERLKGSPEDVIAFLREFAKSNDREYAALPTEAGEPHSVDDIDDSAMAYFEMLKAEAEQLAEDGDRDSVFFEQLDAFLKDLYRKPELSPKDNIADLFEEFNQLMEFLAHSEYMTEQDLALLAQTMEDEIDKLTFSEDLEKKVIPEDSNKNSPKEQHPFIAENSNMEAFRMNAFPDYTLRIQENANPVELGIDKVKQITGYLDVDDDKHFFFWFFESRNDPANDPVVLWLNGGPGCSSLTGLFMELGPSMIDLDTVKPIYNNFSWNANASVIFLDQPINVGFSTGDDSVSDTLAAGKDVYAFLNLFFTKYSQYADKDFHISGESYAGHYIPAFSRMILEHNKGASDAFVAAGYEDTKVNINLKSALIGNGLTDPLVQYKYYSKMACENSYGPVLPQEECDKMDRSYGTCSKLIKTCYDTGFTPFCVGASIYCNNAMMGPFQKTGLNIYDIREKCDDEASLCYPQLNAIEEYLNQAEVQQALGVEPTDYKGCNTQINIAFLFKGDWMRRDFRDDVTFLLDSGFPVLIYAGDADFICNHMGNEAWTDELDWSGHSSYAPLELKPWSVSNSTAGLGKSYKQLTYLRVFGAGHMVPFNQPEASLAMLNQWLSGELAF
ncbi:vacuolar carboxypeptidase Y [Schizosaccharomyces japonicus yFS275]|uniref:Carboxypeptidase n=1 Tax=Schizosaccharomyces japonicus (strain yFS275 / FY16936) TaxID=402676 RepID=B6JZ44_SCHJY|nr:vacuolar carboxypeptidase Y [Schizosaccharomyces japonicus yFS275]EEB06812.1 vacuolar carboxypeptidase Y [Schizosaccharomyces japonicus yFS275]